MRGIPVRCRAGIFAVVLLAGCAAQPQEVANPWPLNGTTFRLVGSAPRDFRGNLGGDFRGALRAERLLQEHRNLFWGEARDALMPEIEAEW